MICVSGNSKPKYSVKLLSVFIITDVFFTFHALFFEHKSHKSVKSIHLRGKELIFTSWKHSIIKAFFHMVKPSV